MYDSIGTVLLSHNLDNFSVL